MTNKKKLEKTLATIIPVGNGLYLGEDTFLTCYLDGSDKIYGFINDDGNILVDAGGMNGYPISDMDKEDVSYIFNLSAPNIYKRIKDNYYEIVLVD